MKKIKTLAASALAMALPMAAAAAATVTTALSDVKYILNYVIGILFVLVTLYFIWGIVQYVLAAGKEEQIKEGKRHMIWGIIGMAVMAGAWGLVSILLRTFDVQQGTGGIQLPTTGF